MEVDMKKNSPLLVFACLAAGCAVFVSCASSPSGRERAADVRFDSTDAPFARVIGKTWKLYSVLRGDTAVYLDRDSFEHQSLQTDAYALTFGDIPVNNPNSSPRISGKGAANSFIATYALGEKQNIFTLQTPVPVSTKMFAFNELKQLSEHEFFVYITNITAWKLRDGNLMLLTKALNGEDVVLEFTAD
jgi:hypothetical protein